MQRRREIPGRFSQDPAPEAGSEVRPSLRGRVSGIRAGDPAVQASSPPRTSLRRWFLRPSRSGWFLRTSQQWLIPA
jgi:hypothetical protein